jgi:uracil-DNA glycosylase
VDPYTEETIEDIPNDDDYNYIMTSPHPAAEVYAGGKAGFFGCNHFYFTNVIVEKRKKNKIIW